MGSNCTPLRRSKSGELTPSEKKVWEQMLSISFEKGDCKLLLELQERYSDLDGQFLRSDALGAIVLELKRFLFLSWLKSQRWSPEPRQIVPSPIVDRAWRVLITFTPIYQKFCNKFFKSTLHRDSEQIINIDDYVYSLRFYNRVFGAPSSLYWPNLRTQKELVAAHQQYMQMECSEFQLFVERFRGRYERKRSLDLHGVLSRSIDNQRSRLQRNNESQCRRDRLREREELELERQPFGSFAKLDRTCVSQSDLRQLNGFEQESPRRRHSFSEFNGTCINMLPTSTVRFSALHGNLSRFLPSYKDTERFGLSGRIKKIDPEHHDLLKTNWRKKARYLEEDLDLEQICPGTENNFMKETASSMATTSMIFREYKRFLLMHSISSQSTNFVPSTLVKLMWDYHAIETKEYAQFCERIFGKLIPVIHLQSNPSLLNDYTRTLETYTLLFKHEAPRSAWEPSETRFRLSKAMKFYNPRKAVEYLFERTQQAKDETKRREKLRSEWQQALAEMHMKDAPDDPLQF